MEQTAIKAGLPPGAVNTAITANVPVPRVKEKSFLFSCLETAASLRITVTLFALSIFLVYFGTWAQRDTGIWTVVNDYFRWWIVWIPLRVVFMYSIDGVPGSIPYPGGWLLGTLLLINLVAAHAVRFKLSWKRSGILVLHAGLIVMMLGELITGLFAIEGHMKIMEGTSANFVEHDRVTELAIVDRSDANVDKETIVPGRLLVDGSVIRDNSALPFDVEIVEYMKNSDILSVDWQENGPAIPDNKATVGIGLRKLAKSRPETAGADSEQRPEMPSAYVTLKEKGTGKPLGTYLLSTMFSYYQMPMDEVVVGGKRYAFALRFERDYRDYAIQLLRFSHDKYIGTEKAKNFASKVVVRDTTTPDKSSLHVDISMNHPLFFHGETFYQSGLHPLTKGTILQVVRNPGWWMPYISCVMVTGGMLIHFGWHLFGFLQKRFK